ncbi:MAG: plasmid mobilization relaxosome protein MobC [Sulfurovum sp.]|nr:plasmid mobilization relaxosome protein MobC [Sulfurovum sp.]
MRLKQIKVNFHDDVHEKISALAEDENLTIAQWIRKSIDPKLSDDMTIPSRPKPKNNQSFDPRLLYEIHKIGININQIAFHLNSKKELDRMVISKLFEIEKT